MKRNYTTAMAASAMTAVLKVLDWGKLCKTPAPITISTSTFWDGILRVSTVFNIRVSDGLDHPIQRLEPTDRLFAHHLKHHAPCGG